MKFSLKTIRRITVFVAGGISTTYLYGSSRINENLKKSLKSKEGDAALPLPEKVRSLIQEVTREIKLDYKVRVIPFMTKGTDVKSVGFSLINSDVYLAIPKHYEFDENGNKPFTVVIDEKEIPDNEPDFRSLKEAMSLSKAAKKFAIAHEIYESQHSQVALYGFLPMAVTLNAYFMSYLGEKLDKRVNKPIRLSQHCLLFFLAAWMYALLHDVYSVYIEAHSDFLVAEMGKTYIDGGIEFYQKMIQRNEILKKLKDDAPYTEKGDVNTSKFRTTHMSLPRRVTYLNDIKFGKKDSIWNYIFA